MVDEVFQDPGDFRALIAGQQLECPANDARARVTEAEGTSAQEITALREERDLIRSRVAEMLQQIESLNL